MVKRTILVALAICSVAGVQAQSVSWASSNGYGAGHAEGLVHPGLPTGSYFAGTLHFTTSTNNLLGPGTGTDVYSVCGDLNDVFAPPYSWGVTLWDSQAAPGGLGIKYAGNIVAGAGFDNGWTSLSSLGLGTNYSTANGRSSANQATGLQLAVWEAEYDFGADGVTASLLGTPDFTSGAFKTTTSLGSGVGSVSWWANKFWQDININRTAVFLQAAAGSGGQDQFAIYVPGGQTHISQTPEPFTATLGLAAIGLFIKRRGKRGSRA
jgi:hypothetical protein